jgi:YD repeat-containing protein
MRKRAKSSASRTTTYTHDNSGDLIQETTGTEVTAYEYDALGRMVQGTNAQGDISEYVYNGLGKRAAAVQTIMRSYVPDYQ